VPPLPLAPPPVNPPSLRHDSQPALHIIRARASGRSVWVASPCGRSPGAGAGRRSFGWLVGPRRRWRRSAAERRSPSRSSSPSPSSAPASCSTASSTRYNLPRPDTARFAPGSARSLVSPVSLPRPNAPRRESRRGRGRDLRRRSLHLRNRSVDPARPAGDHPSAGDVMLPPVSKLQTGR